MDIEDQIRALIVTEMMTETESTEIGAQDSLRAAHGMDSLGFVELRVQCEDRFGIVVSDEDFSPENFQSIASVAQLVRTQLAVFP